MFDIGWGELIVIGIVALIAIGPKELPAVLRTVGQWMAKVRRMASEFQDQFREAMREAEMTDLKKQVDEMTSTAGSYTNFDPLGSVSKEIENAVGDAPTLDDKPSEPAAEPKPAEVPPTSQSASDPAPLPADGRKAGDAA